jgi:signal transduction histidine kinase
MAERLKSNFVSTASHQFRTPLTGIKWGLMTLQGSEDLTADQRSLITQLLERSEHTIELVNQLLDITRLEEGRTQYICRTRHR